MGGLIKDKGDLFLPDPAGNLGHLEINDAGEHLLGKCVEDNDVVEAVEELGFEDTLRLLQDLALHGIVAFVMLGSPEA